MMQTREGGRGRGKGKELVAILEIIETERCEPINVKNRNSVL
jgi:hypothetical protein